MATYTKLDNDGLQWYELNGVDYGTDWEFNGSIYGITKDGSILDEEGYPLTEGDFETIAVLNTINE